MSHSKPNGGQVASQPTVVWAEMVGEDNIIARKVVAIAGGSCIVLLVFFDFEWSLLVKGRIRMPGRSMRFLIVCYNNRR